jgi:hypothetical protein
MKVRAKQLGYYGKKRQYEGDVFDVDEKHFSKRWMEKFVEGEPEKKAEKPAKTHDKDRSVI